ncbi:hypothetical protein GCM10008019_26570 [Deinococcus soli (ex Cha et al. 2016)]|nr:hypothetical protein GCM10008019_26570 [Deinococcus soli (ex Cha et al. 2016)]
MTEKAIQTADMRLSLGMSQVRRPSFIPQPVRGEVSRNHLLRTDAQILWLTAPSGYGKTVLSAQLARHTPDVPIWIRVTRDAADPDALGDLMGQALRAAGYGTPELTAALHAERGLDALSRALLADLAAVPDDLILILDNAEHLSASSAGVLTAVLEQLPPWHRALVNATPDSHLSLVRLVASGQAHELDAEALRFNLQETQAFLANLGARERADAQALHQQTDGWPAALALATLRGRSEDSAAIVEHVLRRMTPDLQALVLRAAVEPLWDAQTPALVDLPPRPDWLREVTRAGLPVTQEGAATRPHALVADALDRILARDHTLYAAQHHAAARRAANTSNWYRALHHALTAQDYPYARHLVTTYLLRTWTRHSNWALLIQTLERFPREHLSPDLLAFLGLAYGETGQSALAREIFTTQTNAGQETPITFLGLMFSAARAQDLPTMKTMAERGLKRAWTPYERTQLLRGLATYHLYLSQLAQARAFAQQAVTVAQSAGDHSLVISARTVEFWCLKAETATISEGVTLGTALLHDALALGFVNKGLILAEDLICAMIDTGRLDETGPIVALAQPHTPKYAFVHHRFLKVLGDLALLRGDATGAVEAYECALRENYTLEDRTWVPTVACLYLAAIVAGRADSVDTQLDEVLATEPNSSMHRHWLANAQIARHLIRHESAAALALADEYRSRRPEGAPSMNWDYVIQDYLRIEAKRALKHDVAEDLRALLDDRIPLGTGTILRFVPPQLCGAAAEGIRLGIHRDAFAYMTQRATPDQAAAQVRVQTLGGWAVTVNGVPVKLPHLPVELLVYLSLYGPTTIEQLGEILAPTSRAARSRVHRAKADLHRLTGHALIDAGAVAQGGLYRIASAVDVQVDVLELFSATRAEDAYALLRGPFLPDAAEDSWVGDVRERVTRRVAHLYEVRAAEVSAAEPGRALMWYWHAARLTPWNVALWREIEQLGTPEDVVEARIALRDLASGETPTPAMRDWLS